MAIEHHDLGENKITCPWCAAIHDCAMNTGAEPGPPEDGSINICINCERISVYEEKARGGLRLPTDDEHTEAMGNPEVLKALWALRRTHVMIQRSN